MNNLFLIEDHSQALKLWRQKKIKGLDLVHIDAHMDLAFRPEKPLEKILNEARNLKELKKNLEYTLGSMHYEKDFDKQTDTGNYIYPAMQEGIIKNFYWVIPGRQKEFKVSPKIIKDLLKKLIKLIQQDNGAGQTPLQIKEGLIRTHLLGRDFIICALEKLPVLKQRVLLDIDTDFLVINSLSHAASTVKIGKRKPWILSKELVEILKEKIKQPEVITIAYSVNGGWTPIKYKYLGDEIAYYFAPRKFKSRLKNNLMAAQYFNLFTSKGKKEYYQKAVKFNPTYRAADNNYGPLYLSLRKFSLAQKEFLRVLRVDSKNPACLWGLGNVALERKDFRKAKRHFLSAVKIRNHKLFAEVKNRSLFGLARVEYELGNYKTAKELLRLRKKIRGLHKTEEKMSGIEKILMRRCKNDAR